MTERLRENDLSKICMAHDGAHTKGRQMVDGGLDLSQQRNDQFQGSGGALGGLGDWDLRGHGRESIKVCVLTSNAGRTQAA